MEVLAHLRRSRVKVTMFFELVNANVTVKTKTKSVFVHYIILLYFFPRLRVPHDFKYPMQSIPRKCAISE